MSVGFCVGVAVGLDVDFAVRVAFDTSSVVVFCGAVAPIKIKQTNVDRPKVRAIFPRLGIFLKRNVKSGGNIKPTIRQDRERNNKIPKNTSTLTVV